MEQTCSKDIIVAMLMALMARVYRVAPFVIATWKKIVTTGNKREILFTDFNRPVLRFGIGIDPPVIGRQIHVPKRTSAYKVSFAVLFFLPLARTANITTT